MPDLPPLPTLSDEHFAMIVDAFPGATLEEKAQWYINWSLNNLIQRVETVAMRRVMEQAEIDRIAQINAVRAAMPDRLPFQDFDESTEVVTP